MRRVLLVSLTVGVVLGALAGSAFAASSVYLCVPSTAGASVTSGGSTGSCEPGTNSVALPAEKAEQEKLISILPDMKYVKEGVDKKPTIQFSGANLQVIDGSGSETTVNGTGNLILGYDEKPGAQTGSHDLLLGGTGNSYTSYGGLVGGYNNKITSAYASVLDGAGNTASGEASTITGGYSNQVSSGYGSVTGGCSNLAGTGTVAINSFCTSPTSFIHGFASVTGGLGNQASGRSSVVTSGAYNLANDLYTSISGGCSNFTSTGTNPGYNSACVATANKGYFASISGGIDNQASAIDASVSGGGFNDASGTYGSVSGGASNGSEGEYSSVSGGDDNHVEADGYLGSILGGKDLSEGGTYGVSAGLSEAEQNKLFSIVPYLGYKASGVGATPTVGVVGANLQITPAATNELSDNGAGNLIIGYDEGGGEQTGSENLVMGYGQTYNRNNSIIAGQGNTDESANSVLLGYDNTAKEGEYNSILGGYDNKVTNNWATILGGKGNTLSTEFGEDY
jgi:hypothetical protein